MESSPNGIQRIALIDLTLPTPEENLALDEALLNQAEAAARRGSKVPETLRLWESPRYFVVAGSTARLAAEVQLENCRREGVRVLRRSSGGGTVVAGPGCLFFSLVLDLTKRPELQDIHRSYSTILERTASGLGVAGLEHQGISDLAVDNQKISGNAQRRKKHALLHHGTVLYDFDIGVMNRLLKDPPKCPAYREGRRHQEFATNLDLPVAEIKSRLANRWNAAEPSAARELPAVDALVKEKYANADWIERF